MSFDRSQQSYYVREINRAVTYPGAQSSINPSSLSASLGEPDGGTVSLDSIVSDNANIANLQRRDAACRALPYPGPGMRDPAARSGCGWWFTPDPSQSSISAYGTRRGPMSSTLDTSIGPGKWIWDPRDAQRMEGMKQTANIAACPDIQFAKFPNVGWCPTTNMAILTDGGGNPMFPTMPGGDCPGTPIVMNAASCPSPPPPSAGGGAGAGPTPSLSPSITQLCTPGAGGALSPQCLFSLVGAAQCSTNTSGASAATLAVALSNGYAGTSQDFNNTNTYLAARGFQINSGIINDGKVSMGDALSSIQGLRQLANSGDGSTASAAAANLCYGKPFNPCAGLWFRSALPGNSWSTVSDCIRKAALDRGYAPNAGLMPSNIGIAYWDQNEDTWGGVTGDLDWWMSKAHDQTDPNLQKAAIENVYGLNLNFPAQTCPIPPVGV